MQERAEPKKMRYDDSRRLEERINELSHLTFSIDKNDLDKIKGLAPPGWTYAWILASIYGEPNERINHKMMDGWSPVPADRHPNLFFNDVVDGRRSPSQAGYISYKGVIVCERPTVICQKEEEAYRQRANKAASSIPDADKYMNDPYMQARFTVNPELTRNAIARVPY